jgi:hypothetical protein
VYDQFEFLTIHFQERSEQWYQSRPNSTPSEIKLPVTQLMRSSASARGEKDHAKPVQLFQFTIVIMLVAVANGFLILVREDEKN